MARRARPIRVGILVAAVLAVATIRTVISFPMPEAVAEASPYRDTSTVNCLDWTVYIPLGITDIDLYDVGEGWVYVDPAQKFRSATGIATRSEVTYKDFVDNHDSHDQNTDIFLDPGQEGLLSPINKDTNGDGTPDAVEVEWETGTLPSETGRTVPERIFPKWAWPSEGDRVWVDGHWIVDCGHSKAGPDGKTYYPTELHPMRAIASMRDQVHTLPRSGITPVRVTATDLFIHGGGGFAIDVISCGQQLIIEGDPNRCPTKTSPIQDIFEFDIPLPPRPSAGAALSWTVHDGPNNSIGVAPQITPVPTNDPTKLHVRVDLTGGGIADLDVYARNIYAGWVNPEPLRRLMFTLHRTDLEDDHDLDPGDCECTFWWLNVNRAPNEWVRLQDWTDGDMNNYDDWHGAGDGLMHFDNLDVPFYVAPGQDFSIRSRGYDQDCYDLNLMDGNHSLDIDGVVNCYAGTGLFGGEPGKNEALPNFDQSYGPPDYGIGYHEHGPSDYQLEYTISEQTIPDYVTNAELTTTQTCVPDGLLAVGKSARCTIAVTNNGPGLPREVSIVDNVTSTGSVDVGAATYDYEGLIPGSHGCSAPSAGSIECSLLTIPVGKTAAVGFDVTALSPGTITSSAVVSSATTDDTSDNAGADSVTAADLKIQPAEATHELGAPGQTHAVTATVVADGSLSGVPVTFTVTGGPNAGATATVTTNALGEAGFSYVAKQRLAGLGTDHVAACMTDAAGNELCREALVHWVDTTPPATTCPRGPNPSGNIPSGAPSFYVIHVTDAVDPNPSGFVVDTGSGHAFGPFPDGTTFKYIVRKNSAPRQERMTGEVDWKLSGSGDPAAYGIDSSGNDSAKLACPTL